MRFRILPIILILFYFVGMAINYNRAIPIFESSDEAEHFLYIHSILTNRALPVIQSREEVALEDNPIVIWNNHVHHAPLYYLLSAGLISWSERGDIEDFLEANSIIFTQGLTDNNPNKWLHSPYPSDGDTGQAVFILRMMNTFIGMLTLCVVYLTGMRAFGQRAVALGAMAFVASIPSFIVVHSSLNNDTLVIFFYSLGILWLVSMWGKSSLSNREIVTIGLIVAGAALSKLTGLSLAGVVVLGLLMSVRLKHLSFYEVVKLTVVMVGIVLLLAGWWYVRNYQLYGDFFAQSATQSLWGREFDEHIPIASEINRLISSFWLMVGYRHQPLLAEDNLVKLGLAIIFLGFFGLFAKKPRRASQLVWVMMMICFVLGVMLFVGTLSVDISYGRILFPALPALALWVMWGIWSLTRGWGITIVMVALIVATIKVPATIQFIYSPIEILASNPEAIDGLVIEKVYVEQPVITREIPLRFELTFSGRSDDNAYLLATAVDSVTQKRLGHVEIYPGMAPTNRLLPDGRYQTWVTIPITFPYADQTADLNPLSPRMVDIYLSWSDNRSQSTRYDGAIWLDSYYDSQLYTAIKRQVVFGDQIQLDGYALNVDGQSVKLDLWWTALDQIDEDWVLTVQLFDQVGNLIAQTDGLPAGYPPTRWIEGLTFVDHRTLSWDTELPEDQYNVMLAWYRLDDLERLPITSETAINQILLVQTIYISQ
jgi:hypothetical protein